MLSEGVVDALKNAHRALRPGGLLLDLQPEAGDPPVEVIRDGRVVGSTPQDESWCAEQIAKARAIVAELVDAGWFAVERTRRYEWRQHATTVDDWAAYRASKGMTPLEDDLVRRVRDLATDGADEIVKRERCVATVLRRTEPRRPPAW
jgi:predicted SAM-dependent methyltransferase